MQPISEGSSCIDLSPGFEQPQGIADPNAPVDQPSALLTTLNQTSIEKLPGSSATIDPQQILQPSSNSHQYNLGAKNPVGSFKNQQPRKKNHRCLQLWTDHKEV